MMNDEVKVDEKQQSIEQTVTALSKSVQSLSDRILSLDGKLTAVAKTSDQALELCEGTTLKKAKEDVKAIHDLYRLAYLKLTVATEVLWVEKTYIQEGEVGKLALAVITAFDHPDSWWQSREHWTLKQWIETLRRLAGSPDLHHALAVSQ